MIIHSTLLLATAVISAALGLFVYWRNREGLTNQAWLALTLGVGCWSLGFGLMLTLPGHAAALAWARVAHVGAAVIPVAFLRFTLALIDGPRPGRRAVTGSRLVAGLLAAVAGTPYLVADVAPKLGFRYYAVPGTFYPLFLAISAGYFAYTFWVLWIEYREPLGARRTQIKYVMLASALGFGCYSTAYPLVYNVPIPPVGSFLILYYFVIAYAIIRWRLMDVRVVVKNTVLYATLYSVVVGLFVTVVVFVGQWLFYGAQTLDRRVLWMCMIALSVVVAAVRPLDSFLRKLTDRVFFQKKYEYQRTLKAASKGMAKITNVDHLLQLTVHFISKHVRVTHVGVFLRTSDQYTLKISRGREKHLSALTVARENPLVVWLEEKRDVLVEEEVVRWLRSERLFPHRTVLRKVLEDVRREMEHLGAKLCVPTFNRNQMLGFLMLGEKLSGEPYTQEDIDVLATLSNEAAIALENAHLYEQLYHRMQEIHDLYQKEHRLFIHTAVALAAAVDARDPYTHGHTERCTAYAMAVAEEMEPHPEMQAIPRFKELLNIAALLHDVGKIGVPDDILNKRGKLTPKEFKKMQEHPIIGAVILQPIKGLEEVAAAVRAHQERYDGRGYPDRLHGREIPLMARIIAVADTFDAMTTDRPYRARLSDAATIKEIKACAGTQFDPMAVDAFLRAYEKGGIVNRPVDVRHMLG